MVTSDLSLYCPPLGQWSDLIQTQAPAKEKRRQFRCRVTYSSLPKWLPAGTAITKLSVSSEQTSLEPQMALRVVALNVILVQY